jgi:hypothetical protein
MVKQRNSKKRSLVKRIIMKLPSLSLQAASSIEKKSSNLTGVGLSDARFAPSAEHVRVLRVRIGRVVASALDGAATVLQQRQP